VTAYTVSQFSVMTDTRRSGLVCEQNCDLRPIVVTTRTASTKDSRLNLKLDTLSAPTSERIPEPLLRASVQSIATRCRTLLRSVGRPTGPAICLIASAFAAAPLHSQTSSRFDSGIVVGGDWLQANQLPLDRDAVQSGQVTVSLRRQRWAVDASWVRVARSLSTVQGGALSAGPLLHVGPVLLLPTVGVLGGQAQASRDTTGYDFTGPGGTVGHQPRYSYSSSGTFGGGVSLTVEAPLYRIIGVRAVASQWFFSGAPLDGDRQRFLVGAGLSLRVGR